MKKLEKMSSLNVRRWLTQKVKDLDSVLLANVQNKDVQTVSVEEDIIINKDYDGQCRRPGICSPQNKGCVTKGSTRSRKSGTMETGKSAGSIELCSDSRAPPVSSLLKPKHENAIRARASKSPSNALESGPGRTCKGKLKKEATISHTEIQSTSAQCVTLTSERKPRRPIYRTNSASNSTTLNDLPNGCKRKGDPKMASAIFMESLPSKTDEQGLELKSPGMKDAGKGDLHLKPELSL